MTHQRIGENEVDVDSVCTRILEHLKAAGVPLPLSNIIEFRCREDLETRAEGEGRIYTDLFVGSSLRSVQLPNPGIVMDEEGSPKWGQWVSAPSRGLTQLFIPASYSTVPSAVGDRLLSEFLTLPHLRELAIPAGMLVRGHGGPLYFTNHPTLEHLTIHSWESPLPAARLGTALGLFTHLRVLTLSVDVVYVNWPLQFLQQHVPPSTLETFTIVFNPRAKGSSRTTLNSILAFLSPSTLTSLSVFLPGAEHDERIRWRDAVQRGAPLALDDLSPLLRLRSLRELRVEYPGRPVPVANFLWELFPCVESLRFVVGRPDTLHVEDDMWGWKAVLESMMGSLDEVRKDRCVLGYPRAQVFNTHLHCASSHRVAWRVE